MKPFVFLFACLFTIASSLTVYAGATAWTDFEMLRGDIRIASEIQGIKGYSIIDSGSNSISINENFLTEHQLKYPPGERVVVRGVHGSDTKRMLKDIDLGIFGISMRLAQVVPLDLSDLNFQALLGGPLLEKFIIQIDYPKGKIRFVDRDAMKLQEMRNIESKRDVTSGMPLVKVQLAGEDVWMLLDTGNSGGIYLDRKVALRNNWLEKYSTNSEALLRGVVKAKAVEQIVLPSLSVGPFNLTNLTTYIPEDGLDLRVSREYRPTGSRLNRAQTIEGILGYDVLKHFLLTLDYKNGYVHMYPSEGE